MIAFMLTVSAVNLVICSSVFFKYLQYQLAFSSQKAAESSVSALLFFNSIFLVFINFSENSHLYAMIIAACFLFSLCRSGSVFISQKHSELAFCGISFAASILFALMIVLKIIPILKSMPL